MKKKEEPGKGAGKENTKQKGGKRKNKQYRRKVASEIKKCLNVCKRIKRRRYENEMDKNHRN